MEDNKESKATGEEKADDDSRDRSPLPSTDAPSHSEEPQSTPAEPCVNPLGPSIPPATSSEGSSDGEGNDSHDLVVQDRRKMTPRKKDKITIQVVDGEKKKPGLIDPKKKTSPSCEIESLLSEVNLSGPAEADRELVVAATTDPPEEEVVTITDVVQDIIGEDEEEEETETPRLLGPSPNPEAEAEALREPIIRVGITRRDGRGPFTLADSHHVQELYNTNRSSGAEHDVIDYEEAAMPAEEGGGIMLLFYIMDRHMAGEFVSVLSVLPDFRTTYRLARPVLVSPNPSLYYGTSHLTVRRWENFFATPGDSDAFMELIDDGIIP